jgi:Rhodopirellula transposase DDE domain
MPISEELCYPSRRTVPGWPPVREHDVTALTAAELERARRELAASLALARPGSPAHMPPGTSKWNKWNKWNKIEHRLFSHISMNWTGQPLTSYQVAVSLIAGTTTRTGLTVHAERDTSTYPRGIKIPDREMKTLTAQHLTLHDWHGEWNYTITPTRERS